MIGKAVTVAYATSLYSGGPFISGEAVTAADVYWAPYLERMAAHVPALHRGLKVCSLVITPTRSCCTEASRFARAASSRSSACDIWLQPRSHTVAASATYGCRSARARTTRSPIGSMPWTSSCLPTAAASRGEPPPGSRCLHTGLQPRAHRVAVLLEWQRGPRPVPLRPPPCVLPGACAGAPRAAQ